MIQEEQAVCFEPMYVDGPMPWLEKLLVLFLLAMAVLLVVRWVRFGKILHRLGKSAGGTEDESLMQKELWAACDERAISLRHFAVFTFLVSLLVCMSSVIDGLYGLWAVRSPSSAYVAHDVSYALSGFSAGVAVCIALYGSAMAMQYLLKRLKPKSATTASVPSP
jgi:hypothetical protein